MKFHWVEWLCQLIHTRIGKNKTLLNFRYKVETQGSSERKTKRKFISNLRHQPCKGRPDNLFDPLMFTHTVGGYQTFHFQLVFDLSEKRRSLLRYRHGYWFNLSYRNVLSFRKFYFSCHKIIDQRHITNRFLFFMESFENSHNFNNNKMGWLYQ